MYVVTKFSLGLLGLGGQWQCGLEGWPFSRHWESRQVMSPSSQQEKVLWDLYSSGQEGFLTAKINLVAASYMQGR